MLIARFTPLTATFARSGTLLVDLDDLTGDAETHRRSPHIRLDPQVPLDVGTDVLDNHREQRGRDENHAHA